MQESSTWRYIVAIGEARGRLNEARRLVIVLGTDFFGAPDETTRDALGRITDVARLERILLRVPRVRSWAAALAVCLDCLPSTVR